MDASPCRPCGRTIDFARTEATTTYGQIGIKVWVYKGESSPEVEEKTETTEGVYVSE